MDTVICFVCVENGVQQVFFLDAVKKEDREQVKAHIKKLSESALVFQKDLK